MKDIWSAICQSQVVIAEMTGFNPNVMYELGISHTVGKETIMMTKNLTEDQKFPFDMAHIRRIQYEDSVEGYPKLRSDLSRTLDYALGAADESLTKSESKGESERIRHQDTMGNRMEQIEKIKMAGIMTVYPERKIKSIDLLVTYGEPAINAIFNIMDSTIRTEIKEHGLDMIRKIREGTKV